MRLPPDAVSPSGQYIEIHDIRSHLKIKTYILKNSQMRLYLSFIGRNTFLEKEKKSLKNAIASFRTYLTRRILDHIIEEPKNTHSRKNFLDLGLNLVLNFDFQSRPLIS